MYLEIHYMNVVASSIPEKAWSKVIIAEGE
jgi:hypothetical protein